MQRFLIKFFIIFVVSITTLFFSLISFQEMSSNGMRPPIPMDIEISDEFIPPQIPPEVENPPAYIPCFLVIILSSFFIWLLLKYLDKNFITPLITIESKLKTINDGNLEVNFETKSENNEVKTVFNTLNLMVQGLKEKECLQNEFIQNLAHDLRSPIIAQERAIEILQDEFEGHELLNGLVENSEFCLKIVNLIIEAYAKKDYVIKKNEFNYYTLVNTLFKSLNPLALSKNIKLINCISENSMIYADYISLNRITMNILSNAIEHIGNNKEIKVSLTEKDKKQIITIEDNGSGIEQDKIDKIFDKYVSYDNAGKKAISGLGLTIAYELVLKNDGNIRVESEINKYTRFIIELPDRKDNNEKV